MRKIDAVNLGGSLFIPATHKDIYDIANARKYPLLKSLVIDLEDSIKEEKLLLALKNVKVFCETFVRNKIFVFIRPRNIQVLGEILSYKGIEHIDGFVLPKFSLENAFSYLEIMQKKNFYIMPSIEGKELFSYTQLQKLKEIILPHRKNIILIRFGLEDMLRQLKMRRKEDESIFDFSVTQTVLGNFLAIFKGEGFSVSGGVYPFFNNDKGFKKDLQRDLKEGLFSKTIIHPRQIGIVDESYKVSQKEYDEALEISESDLAVFKVNGAMAEKTTMMPYSLLILQRARDYGIV